MLQDGCTPLYIASKTGHVEVVKALLDTGANTDTPYKVCLRQVDARLQRAGDVRLSRERVHGMRIQPGRR